MFPEIKNDAKKKYAAITREHWSKQFVSITLKTRIIAIMGKSIQLKSSC